MRGALSVIGGLALAIVFSQFPEYAQQYTQRLGGAVDELRVITAEFDAAAIDAGLTRAAALQRYEAVDDTFVVGRGRSMRRTFERYQALQATLEDIRGAMGWERLALLPSYFDTDVGRRTLENYVPAVPVTLEGFAYAGLGFVAGYAISSALVALLMLPLRRRRRRAGPA